MNINKKILMLKISAILSYVFAGLYSLVTVWFYSLSNDIFWLFLAALLMSMITGLLVSGVRDQLLTNSYDDKAKKNLLIYLIVGFVSPVSLVLNLLVYLDKTSELLPEDKVMQVVEPKVPETKPLSRKRYLVLTCIALAVIMVFGFVASLIQTNGYQVEISNFTLTKEMTEQYNATAAVVGGEEVGGVNIIEDDMYEISVDVYKPDTATAENPAPVVFVLPGFTRTKETQTQYAIELARRGFVVIISDPGSQGDTTAAGYEVDEDGNYVLDDNGDKIELGSTSGNNGTNYLWQYVYNNVDEFDYIDRDRIGATGHSAGGGDVVKAAAAFTGSSYDSSFIKALYCSGYIKTSAANKYTDLRCNAVMSYAYWDEGAYRYQTSSTAFEVIALRFINEVNGEDNGYSSIEYSVAYGSMEDGTYRMVNNEMTNHCFEPYDALSIANMIDFFTESLGMGTDSIVEIDGSNQIWFLKECCTGLALIGAFMLVMSLSGLLITTPLFKSLRAPAVAPLKRQSGGDKVVFWVTALVSAIIACLDYIPLAYLSTLLFPDASNNVFTFVFPARMFNAVLLWAVVNGLIGLLIFFGTYFTRHWLLVKIRAKKAGEKPVYDFADVKNLGLNWKDALKTILLACILFGAFYGMSHLSDWLFDTDFRFMLISSGTINARFFVTWLMYIPLLFIFYISNSIRVNLTMNFVNWKEWKVMLVGGITNSIGLVFMLLLNYIPYFTTGTVYYTYMGAGQLEVWLYMNIIFGLVVMMFILPIFNRIFFKQTNKVWLGALTNVMIFAMMSLLATVSYIPM